MSRWLWASALLLVACGRNTPGIAEGTQPSESVVVLRGGESAQVLGTPLRLTFRGVPVDFRCPSDVVCVSAGDATVEIAAVSRNSFSKLLLLHAYQQPQQDEIAGYVVRLEGLEPLPRAGIRLPLEDYRVTLNVVAP